MKNKFYKIQTKKKIAHDMTELCWHIADLSYKLFVLWVKCRQRAVAKELIMCTWVRKLQTLYHNSTKQKHFFNKSNAEKYWINSWRMYINSPMQYKPPSGALAQWPFVVKLSINALVFLQLAAKDRVSYIQSCARACPGELLYGVVLCIRDRIQCFK